MQHRPTNFPHVARVAALIAGVVVALVVGTPWLLTDAPPSPEAVVAATVCCATAHAQ